MKLDTVIDDIVESYQKHNDISKVDTIRQPDKTIIIDILERLQDIIFPGFFGRKGLKSDYVKYYLGDQIQIIYNDLKNQILLAFDYCENCKDACKEEEARDKTLAFLKTIPQIREYLATDAQATFDGDPAAISISEIVLSYPGYYAIMVNRIAHELYKEHGFHSDIIEACLAHKEKNKIKAAYNRESKFKYFEEKKELMQWWSKWLNNSK